MFADMLPSIFKVKDRSMLPSIPENSYVLTMKRKELKIGDVVVAMHPYNNMKIVKRVALCDENGIFLIGDNLDESTDSRTFGQISHTGILGKVVFVVN